MVVNHFFGLLEKKIGFFSFLGRIRSSRKRSTDQDPYQMETDQRIRILIKMKRMRNTEN